MAIYAPTEVGIANLALSHLRAGEITTLDDGTTAAIEAKRWYHQSLYAALEAIDWSFARSFTAIVEHSSVTVPVVKPGWSYAIEYPADALKVRGIVRDFGEEPAARFEVGVMADGTRLIYANKREGYVRYTRAVDSPVEFSAQFVDAFSHKLAADMAMGIMGSPELREAEEKLFRQKVLEASAGDLNEGVSDPFTPYTREADWIEAR